MNYKEYFKGKKITLMGLGLLGRGVGDAEFLAECGADLIVTDLKKKEDLEESLSRLSDFKNITYVLGEHRLEDFKNRDLIIKAAGVPLDSSYIAEAKKNNIPVRMSADLFAELSGAPIVGITGTRGKSTVTHLIAHILKADGREVLLGGNVRGVSNLSLLKEARQNTIAVFELDSWQLQGFGEAKISPSVAVFTTFMSDHMNYYKNDTSTSLSAGMALYFADKANIFLHQKPDDIFILGEQTVSSLKEYGYDKKVKAHTIIAGAKNLPKEWKLQILGEHNRMNAGVAIATTEALGVDRDVIQKAVESFKGVSGRLELVRELNGVKIYNDTTATTPDATIAALKALSSPSTGSGQNPNIVLILGGADKGLDMSKLIAELPNHCKEVLLLPGTGTERIKDDLSKYTIYRIFSDAVAEAVRIAEKGDIVLLSPAFASKGMFQNEYDRGDQFVELVNGL